MVKAKAKRKLPARAKKPAPPPPVVTLTRGAVARKLSVSVMTVRRLEESCVLNPTTDVAGVRQFDPAEVERVRIDRAATRRAPLGPGNLASQAFALYEKGSSVADAVMQLEIVPALATKLLDDWRATKRGGVFLHEAICRELIELGAGDPSGELRGSTLLEYVCALRQSCRALRNEVDALKGGSPHSLPVFFETVNGQVSR